MFINTAVSFIAGLTMLLTPVQPATPSRCDAGTTMGGVGTIVGSNLMLDDYQIAIEIDNKNEHTLYLMLGAVQEVAQTAGRMMGDKVHFTGTAIKSDSGDCSVVWLTDWNFDKQ